MYNTIQAGDGGCSRCALPGLNRVAPGVIYLLRHDDYNALKVGVTTTDARADRIRQHTERGWSVIRTWNTPDGATAEGVEQTVLRWWRADLGAPPALSKSEMRSGWSETAPLLWVDVDETVTMIEHGLGRHHA